MRKFDVCIIGGGAAGLVCAASLRRDLKVCMLEKNEILGRKLMATGGGRCNLTNQACEHKNATLDFFASIGLEARADNEGRYYPYSGKAVDVTKILTDAQDTKVQCFLGSTVTEVKKEKGSFMVNASTKDGDLTLCADNLLLATGGKAAPQYGTTGDGYRFAKSFGHSVSKVFPILAPVECTCEDVDLQRLKGIRATGKVTLLKDGAPVLEKAPELGEIQFTADGLSGICVFNLTPFIKAEAGEAVGEAMQRYSISVDLAPDFSEEQLAKRTTSFGILTAELAEAADAAMKRSGCGMELIKDWRFSVKGVKGWRYAQCTSGGVNTDEIDPDTCESKLVPGLYIAGELLDIQGPCGGFNLQNAWETGLAVARAINEKDR